MQASLGLLLHWRSTRLQDSWQLAERVSAVAKLSCIFTVVQCVTGFLMDPT
jgi:hypothetical protein